MADIILTRPERLAVVLHAAAVVQLTGDDLRLLAVLLDVNRDLDADRAAAWTRFRAMVDDLAGEGSLADWAAGLDPTAHAQLINDAELTIGLKIEPRPSEETS